MHGYDDERVYDLRWKYGLVPEGFECPVCGYFTPDDERCHDDECVDGDEWHCIDCHDHVEQEKGVA